MTRIYVDEIFGAAFPDDPRNDEHVAQSSAFFFTRHRMLFGSDPDPKLLTANSPLNGFSYPAKRS